jgi:lipoprotein-releasing system permease protein
MIKSLEKQRYYIDFTLSSLWRRKGKNLALVLAYTLVVFSLASVMFFTQALKREAALVLRGAPEIIVQKLVAGRHDLIPLSYIQPIKAVRGVEDVQARLWGYYFDPIGRATYTIMTTAGLALKDNEIVVGAGISRVRRLFRGKAMLLRTYEGRPGIGVALFRPDPDVGRGLQPFIRRLPGGCHGFGGNRQE